VAKKINCLMVANEFNGDEAIAELRFTGKLEIGRNEPETVVSSPGFLMLRVTKISS
jgi:hypothetical protein